MDKRQININWVDKRESCIGPKETIALNKSGNLDVNFVCRIYGEILRALNMAAFSDGRKLNFPWKSIQKV